MTNDSQIIRKPGQFTTRVTSLRNLTYDIKEIRLKLLEPGTIDFTAGQFIRFEIPAYGTVGKPTVRTYSIASSPAEKDAIELEIRYVPNGVCTTYVHHHLKVGDPITIQGPYGKFGLHDGTGEAIFIAGGSGMAPIKSLLLDMKERKIRRRVRYFFGAKSRRDLFLLEEMRALESALPDFRFIPALSEPEPGDAWDGETGLITDVVDRHVQPDQPYQAYLCGSPAMVDACVVVLKAKGVTDDKIFCDRFVLAKTT